MNFQLRKGGYGKTVANFSSDVKGLLFGKWLLSSHQLKCHSIK
ncbi:hypothetical protein CASFOL_030278 [Castilleja foliolosa]|uniref:Ribosomal protein L32 n=1 Tax=Castilleja foliolosa TaxID=1961234 RepID=A0ABD3C8W1_9LAMI